MQETKQTSETSRQPAIRSPWQLAWRKLKKNKMAIIGVWILIVLHLFSIFANFIAPYGETTSDRRRSYHPPTKVHFFTPEGKLTRPYIYNYRRVDAVRNRYEPDTSKAYPIQFFVRGEKY